MGLDDGVMIKDNYIVVVGGIGEAIVKVRERIFYFLIIEVEMEILVEVEIVLEY